MAKDYKYFTTKHNFVYHHSNNKRMITQYLSCVVVLETSSTTFARGYQSLDVHVWLSQLSLSILHNVYPISNLNSASVILLLVVILLNKSHAFATDVYK